MALTISEYIGRLNALLSDTRVTDLAGRSLSLDEGAARAVEELVAAGREGAKVMIIGNGGSAAIAGHIHVDLCHSAKIKSLIFYDAPLLSALSNDHGYESAFERPVELWARAGDVLMAISSSGRSENILRAVRAARGKGCRVITLTGFRPDNPLRGLGEINFYVGLEDYGLVETAHSALGHFLTDAAAALSRT